VCTIRKRRRAVLGRKIFISHCIRPERGGSSYVTMNKSVVCSGYYTRNGKLEVVLIVNIFIYTVFFHSFVDAQCVSGGTNTDMIIIPRFQRAARWPQSSLESQRNPLKLKSAILLLGHMWDDYLLFLGMEFIRG